MSAKLPLWAAAIALLTAAQAHEIGTTRVSVALENGAYRIELVTDATALAQKIAAATGATSPDAAGPAELQTLLQSHDEMFRRRLQIAFDAAAAHPAIEYSVKPGAGPASGAVAAVRLSGPIPPGARQFTWNYGWTFASYSMTVRNGAGAPSTEWLEGNQASAPFSLASADPPHRFTAWRYLLLGFTHIVPMGLDHMLFVLGIYLLNGRARTVLCQVSAFTVAHSITLGLSMYGLVSAPSRIVEPMIAVSIAYVAVENIFLKELRSWRIALVFTFGLLHGMGFAGALREIGLPRSQFLTALVTFNVGVEAGQLAVIATAFLLVGWHCANRTWYRSRIVVPASAAIACTAVYWTIQRLLA
jgi:hydrogenase/urease accessory protein HupE